MTYSGLTTNALQYEPQSLLAKEWTNLPISSFTCYDELSELLAMRHMLAVL